MLTSLLTEVGLPAQRGQLIGSVPANSKDAIEQALRHAGLSELNVRFSHPEVYLSPGWLDTLDEILTGQQGLCSDLRRELADRERILMAIVCSEVQARELLDELWELGAKCLCYWDEWRVHFDQVCPPRSQNPSENPVIRF